MAVTLTGTGIVFNDATTQTTGKDVTVDTGKLIGFSNYSRAGSMVWCSKFPTRPSPTALTLTTAGTSMATSGTAPTYTITQSTAPVAWTSHAYSAETVTYASCKPSQANTYIMFGLSKTPTSTTSYTNIDFAIYWVADGTIQVYESGTFQGTYLNYNTTTTGYVTFDGTYVRYYAGTGNAMTPFRTVAATGPFYFKAAFYNGGSINTVQAGSVAFDTATSALVKVTGAGGGAAGYTESGGAGGYSERYVDLTGVDTVTVTIGTGGTNVAYYAAGGTGGTSSFGTYASATGGYGANANFTHTGGQSGVGSLGNVNLYSGGGIGHSNGGGGGNLGMGGFSYWGGSSGMRHDSNNPSPAGTNSSPGAGGPGGRSAAVWQGGAGIAGIVAVWSFR